MEAVGELLLLPERLLELLQVVPPVDVAQPHPLELAVLLLLGLGEGGDQPAWDGLEVREFSAPLRISSLKSTKAALISSAFACLSSSRRFISSAFFECCCLRRFSSSRSSLTCERQL